MRKLTKILFPLTLSSTMLTPLVAAQCGTQAQDDRQAQGGTQSQGDRQVQGGTQSQDDRQVQGGTQSQGDRQAQGGTQSQGGTQVQGGTQAPSEENMVSLAKNLDTFMKDEKQNSKTFDVDASVRFLVPLSSNKVEGIYETNGMQSISYIIPYLSQMLQINSSLTDADIANLNKAYNDVLNMPADFLKIGTKNSETPLKYLAKAGEAAGFNFIQNLDEYKNAEIKDLGTISINLNNISTKDNEDVVKIFQDFSNQIKDFSSKPQDKPILLKISYNIKARITLNKKLDFATYANNIFDKNSEFISKMFIRSLKNDPRTMALDEEQIKEIADDSVVAVKGAISKLGPESNAQYVPLNEQDLDNIKKLGKVLDNSNNSISIQLR
ncbi:hypothetical protein ACNQ1M_00345 [Mycoplasma sp. VS424B]|uniref:hypothetical protein n=1 Tax=Mycoplasma sp. VS424B TaxID=3401660 RepID=UPI003AAED1CB